MTRLVARQLMDYLTSADLLLSQQYSFRPGHLTETAILLILSDILQVIRMDDARHLKFDTEIDCGDF